jgi:hypothetical protein
MFFKREPGIGNTGGKTIRLQTMPKYENQQIIDDLVTQAVERFRKNHCDENGCDLAKEKDLVKTLVFDPSSLGRINCSLCARYGLNMPKEVRAVFKHLVETASPD